MTKTFLSRLAKAVHPLGIAISTASRWPNLSKGAKGGIVHYVSADNGAYYAEMWGREGGSYYAVTGAGIYQMPGLAKGAKLNEALDLFLREVVGKAEEGDDLPDTAELTKALSALRKSVADVAKGKTHRRFPARRESMWKALIANMEKQEGWTKESHKRFWEKVSKGEPGGHTACAERMEGKVDDPHAFCAYSEHEATGHWPAERKAEPAAPKPQSTHQPVPGKPTTHVMDSRAIRRVDRMKKGKVPSGTLVDPRSIPWTPEDAARETRRRDRALGRRVAPDSPDVGPAKFQPTRPRGTRPSPTPTRPAPTEKAEEPSEPELPSLTRPGVKVTPPKGYTERRSFSREQFKPGFVRDADRMSPEFAKAQADLREVTKHLSTKPLPPRAPSESHIHVSRTPKKDAARSGGYIYAPSDPADPTAPSGERTRRTVAGRRPKGASGPVHLPSKHHGDPSYPHGTTGGPGYGPRIHRAEQMSPEMAKAQADLRTATDALEKRKPGAAPASSPSGKVWQSGSDWGVTPTRRVPIDPTAPVKKHDTPNSPHSEHDPRAGKVKPSVHTEKFEGSHGRKPRGTGGWAFQYDNDPTPHFIHGSYTDAKRQAQAEGRRRGAQRIHALP